MAIESWKAGGHYTEIFSRAIYYRHKVAAGPTIAFLHGYPSASYDYYKVLPALGNYSYIVHDHPGFGLSAKPLNYSYSFFEQAETAMELWKQLGLKEVHIVSHDYGTTVANEILVRRLQGFEPVKIKSVTFCNGSLHIELAHLKLVQKLTKHPFWGKYIVKLMNKPVFVKNMRDLWYDKSLFDKKEMDVLWEMLMKDMDDDVLHRISQYNNERVKFWHRWIPALSKLDIPVHILWAQEDPIAVKAIAEQLNKEIPDAVYTKLEHCGHYPMLEKPDEWIMKVKEFVSSVKSL